MKIYEKLKIRPVNISNLTTTENITKQDLKTFDIVKFENSDMLYMVFADGDIMNFYSTFNRSDASEYDKKHYEAGVMFYVSDISDINNLHSRHQMYLMDYNDDLTYNKTSFSGSWNIVEVYRKPSNEILFYKMPEIDTFDTSQKELRNYIDKLNYKKIIINKKI